MAKIKMLPKIQALLDKWQLAMATLKETDLPPLTKESDLKDFNQAAGLKHLIENPALYEQNSALILDYIAAHIPTTLQDIIFQYDDGWFGMKKLGVALYTHCKKFINPTYNYLDYDTCLPFILSDRIYRKMQWMEWILIKSSVMLIQAKESDLKSFATGYIGTRLSATTARLTEYAAKQGLKRLTIEELEESFDAEQRAKAAREKAPAEEEVKFAVFEQANNPPIVLAESEVSIANHRLGSPADLQPAASAIAIPASAEFDEAMHADGMHLQAAPMRIDRLQQSELLPPLRKNSHALTGSIHRAQLTTLQEKIDATTQRLESLRREQDKAGASSEGSPDSPPAPANTSYDWNYIKEFKLVKLGALGAQGIGFVFGKMTGFEQDKKRLEEKEPQPQAPSHTQSVVTSESLENELAELQRQLSDLNNLENDDDEQEHSSISLSQSSDDVFASFPSTPTSSSRSIHEEEKHRERSQDRHDGAFEDAPPAREQDEDEDEDDNVFTSFRSTTTNSSLSLHEEEKHPELSRDRYDRAFEDAPPAREQDQDLQERKYDNGMAAANPDDNGLAAANPNLAAPMSPKEKLIAELKDYIALRQEEAQNDKRQHHSLLGSLTGYSAEIKASAAFNLMRILEGHIMAMNAPQIAALKTGRLKDIIQKYEDELVLPTTFINPAKMAWGKERLISELEKYIITRHEKSVAARTPYYHFWSKVGGYPAHVKTLAASKMALLLKGKTHDNKGEIIQLTDDETGALRSSDLGKMLKAYEKNHKLPKAFIHAEHLKMLHQSAGPKRKAVKP